MRKCRPRRKHTSKKKKPERYWNRAFLGATLFGIAAGNVNYFTRLDSLRQEERKFTDAYHGNQPDVGAISMGAIDKALSSGQNPRGKDPYKIILENGGDLLGRLEWLHFNDVFAQHKIPFNRDNIDLKKPDFLSDSLLTMAKTNPELQKDIKGWRELRKKAMSPSVPRKVRAEEVLRGHIEREITLQKDFIELKHGFENLQKQSIEVGILAGAALFTVLALVQLVMHMRRKYVGWRANRAHRTLLGRKEQPIPVPETQQTTSPETQPWPRPIPSFKKPNKPPKETPTYIPWSVLVENALERLSDDLGQEMAKAILDTFGKKFSSSIARDVIEGKHCSLIRLIKRSKKTLEIQGYDADTIIQRLEGEEPEEAIPDGESQNGEKTKRRPHPLDFVKRWGWKPSNFHRLLISYGFDTSESGGGGHYRVKYDGEVLRQPNGLPVQIVHRSSGTEVTPGVAGNVLKRCADFLIRLEEQDN